MPDTSPLLDHCPPTLPREAYVDAAWFDREQKAIWGRHWVCLGRAADFRAATLRRVAVAGQNILVATDATGRRAAFHNLCRHRGSEICETDHKPLRGRLISCPYHAWSYDMAGRLVSTAFATPTGDFDRAQNGLFPVHLREWAGFMLVSLAEDPPPLAPDLGEGALDNWPMDRLVTGHVFEKDLDCNWKVFWENYNECLHCPGIHPGLSARVPVYAKGVMSACEAPGWRPGAPEAPVLEPGARTWTVSGRPCGPEFPNLTQAQRDAAHNFVTLYPTMFVVAHVDYVRSVTLTPLGPERTRLRAEWLFLPETLAAPGFDLADVTDFATGVLIEDGAACEMNQRGLRSPRYQTGRLMPQEFDIRRFHTWVLEALGAAQPATEAPT